MLYALRYEKHTNNDISNLFDLLGRKGLSDKLRKVCFIRDICVLVIIYRLGDQFSCRLLYVVYLLNKTWKFFFKKK